MLMQQKTWYERANPIIHMEKLEVLALLSM